MSERTYRGFIAFATVFVVFSVLLTIGHVFALMSDSVELGRVTASVIICATLAIPAVALLAIGIDSESPARRRWWWMLWLFALVAYMLHIVASYAFFGWSPTAAWARQGAYISVANYALLVLWWVSLILAARRPSGAFALHAGVGLLIIVQFGYTVFFSRPESRSDAAKVIGATLIAALFVGLAWRAMSALFSEKSPAVTSGPKCASRT